MAKAEAENLQTTMIARSDLSHKILELKRDYPELGVFQEVYPRDPQIIENYIERCRPIGRDPQPSATEIFFVYDPCDILYSDFTTVHLGDLDLKRTVEFLSWLKGPPKILLNDPDARNGMDHVNYDLLYSYDRKKAIRALFTGANPTAKISLDIQLEKNENQGSSPDNIDPGIYIEALNNSYIQNSLVAKMLFSDLPSPQTFLDLDDTGAADLFFKIVAFEEYDQAVRNDKIDSEEALYDLETKIFKRLWRERQLANHVGLSNLKGIIESKAAVDKKVELPFTSFSGQNYLAARAEFQLPPLKIISDPKNCSSISPR